MILATAIDQIQLRISSRISSRIGCFFLGSFPLFLREFNLSSIEDRAEFSTWFSSYIPILLYYCKAFTAALY